MKSLLLFLFLTLSFTSYAQSTAEEQYCSIEMASFYYGPKKGQYVYVDYGNATSNKDYEFLTDREGKKIEFFSAMQVVNYMAKNGWSLLSVSPTLPGRSSLLSSEEHSRSLFIFKRKALTRNE